jgi:hypothetical protein
LRPRVSTRMPCREPWLHEADCEVVRAERQAGECRDGPDDLASRLLDFIRPADALNSVSAPSDRTITLHDDSPTTDPTARLYGYHPYDEKPGTLHRWRINRSIRVVRRRQQAGTPVDASMALDERGERSWWRVVGCRVPKQPGPP